MSQMSLSQRLAALPPDPGESPLSQATFTTPLQAVALATGLEYPLWMRQRIMDFYHLPGDIEYERMVSFACRLIRRYDQKIDYDLLYILTIEPYHLIHTIHTISHKEATV